MYEAEKNQRIQKLVNMITYAQAGLEKAKRGAKNQIKKQTGGDPNAQQSLLLLMNKPKLPQFKNLK